MKIKTRYFGTIEVDSKDIIEFEDGIPGFENLKKYVIVEEVDTNLSYLQCVTDGSLAFAIINPYQIKEDYEPVLDEYYFDKLGGGESSEFAVYCIITAKDNIMDSTINLKAPLLIHADRRVGLQVVTDSDYSTRHRIGDLLEGGVNKC